MITVRCIKCQSVFVTDAQSPEATVRCAACGASHRLSALTSSTAGDSMMINPVALKQMLESPPQASRSYERPEPIILCPSCKVRLYVDRKKYGGKRVQCPQCKKPLLVPGISKDLVPPGEQ